jgi:membrane peptidoglycan carboxypeptidase
VGETKQIHKAIAMVIMAIIMLSSFYLWLANKAQRVKSVRLRAAYEDGRISKEQYEKLSKENTLIKMLTDPKYVFEVD